MGRPPSKHYLEKKLEWVEKNEPRAEPLSDVLTVKEDEGEVLRTVWTASGSLKAIKVGNTIPLPSNPEEVRKRIVVMGGGRVDLRARGPFQSGLLEGPPPLPPPPRIFQEYLEYLLGETVMGLVTQGTACHKVLHVNLF